MKQRTHSNRNLQCSAGGGEGGGVSIKLNSIREEEERFYMIGLVGLEVENW